MNQSSEPTLLRTDIRSLPLIANGKVRDIYAVDNEHLLFVASDRLSAFDVVLPDPIPGKGRVLTELSHFWFGRMGEFISNHLTDVDPESVVSADEREQVRGRSMVVKRLTPLPVEAVVRGYVIGSGWKEYQNGGSICGIVLPSGIPQAGRLEKPIFTPANKAEAHAHDENISFETVAQRIGQALAEQIRDVSLRIYDAATAYADEHGLIIADTKFEFGLDGAGKLVLMDEILTPDSSRFWAHEDYRTGISPPSFDKQFVRDYLETLDWDKTDPGPRLPTPIIDRTAAKYREAKERLITP